MVEGRPTSLRADHDAAESVITIRGTGDHDAGESVLTPMERVITMPRNG